MAESTSHSHHILTQEALLGIATTGQVRHIVTDLDHHPVLDLQVKRDWVQLLHGAAH
jgi:hypothetical protein